MRWLTSAAVRKVAYPVVMAVLGALVDGGILDQEVYRAVVGVVHLVGKLFAS